MKRKTDDGQRDPDAVQEGGDVGGEEVGGGGRPTDRSVDFTAPAKKSFIISDIFFPILIVLGDPEDE